jgi:hypothetical protein
MVIVISVCHNKSNIKKKYLQKKPILSLINPNDHTLINGLSSSLEKKDDRVINNNQFERYSNDDKHQIINSKQNRLSEKLLLETDEGISLTEVLPKAPPKYRERLSSNRLLSTSSASYSQKMCIQLQITISLLAISICFIFCTLPNCISTIMIQTHNQNEQRRKFWQAMNYLSIVPLLITHSVNLIFYYLSSNMFRDRLKENYLRKKHSTKHFSLRSLSKT